MADKCIVEATSVHIKTAMDALARVDWSQIVDYGYVKVRVEKGQASMLTIEQTFKM